MAAPLMRVGSRVDRINRKFNAFVLTIDTPTRPEDIAKRHHNKFAKEAMNRMLVTHHEQRLPKHFENDAHTKYGYADRSNKYKVSKLRKFHSITDLVKTGASRRKILSKSARKITIGGAAEGGKKGLTGTLEVRFSFLGGTGRFRRKDTHQEVSVEQMKKEVRATTRQERREMAKQCWREYWAQVKEFRGSRKRVRMPTS
jgi:hypothetical protein